MHRRRRWTVATVVALLLVTGWFTERDQTTPLADLRVGNLEAGDSELVSLGPVVLIDNDYTVTLTFPCDDAQNGSASFSASDIPGVPGGATIVSAGFNFNVAGGWVSGSTSLTTGVISVAGTHPGGGCGTANPMIVVSGGSVDGHRFVHRHDRFHHRRLTAHIRGNGRWQRWCSHLRVGVIAFWSEHCRGDRCPTPTDRPRHQSR